MTGGLGMIDHEIDDDWDAVEISDLRDESDFEEALDQADASVSDDDHSSDVIIEPDPEWRLQRLSSRWMAAIVASLILHAWMGTTLSSMVIEDREYETVIPIESKIALDEPDPEQPDPE